MIETNYYEILSISIIFGMGMAITFALVGMTIEALLSIFKKG